jgi:hypothetical protein
VPLPETFGRWLTERAEFYPAARVSFPELDEAGALAKHIASATGDLSSILIAVRSDVMKETQHRQVPWEHTSERFHFARR